jgi:hypothetical protein
VVKTILALIIGSLLLFLAAMPGNHSEAEDAFEYSRLVEEGQGAAQFHPHHLLYIPTLKMVFNSMEALGYEGRSYPVVRAVSMVGGSAVLCLFFLVASRLQLLAGNKTGWRVPMVGTLGVLFSYGFLRYACEAEIYVPAMALALVPVCVSLRENASWRWFATGVFFAAFALLMHIINAGVVLVVVPLIYLTISKKWKRAVLHGLLTAALVGAVYWFVGQQWGTFRPITDTASEGGLQPGTLGKAMVGLGQCLLSGNFFFAYEPVAAKLQAWFPYRVFAEELFTAQNMPSWIAFVAPATFLLALSGIVAAGVLVVWVALRHGLSGKPVFWILALWSGGTMAPTLWLEPSNPELWVMSLVPLWGIVAWLLLETHCPRFGLRVVTLFVMLMGMHNLFAGMGSIKSSKGDYFQEKSKWVLEHAGTGDTIHTADSYILAFYLNYWSNAEIRNVNSQDWKPGRTTYVFSDVFDPPPAIGVRYPEFARKVADAAQELQPISSKIHDDQFGGIWIVNKGATD